MFPHTQTNCGCSGHRPSLHGQKEEVSHCKHHCTQLPCGLSSCNISTHKTENSLSQSHQSVPGALPQSPGHLRLMDAAVVENKIHRGKFLPRLLGFQVELHHPLITCKRPRQKKTSERTQCMAQHSVQGLWWAGGSWASPFSPVN